jgi:hypothetical protein
MMIIETSLRGEAEFALLPRLLVGFGGDEGDERSDEISVRAVLSV